MNPLSYIIRENPEGVFDIVLNGRFIHTAEFTAKNKASRRRAEAHCIKWIRERSSSETIIERQTVIVTEPTHGERCICHITDCGDQTEPKGLSGTSLIVLLRDQGQSSIRMTAEEMDNLAKAWLKLRRTS